MNLLISFKNRLRYIAYSKMLLFVVSCAKLPPSFARKHTQQVNNRFSKSNNLKLKLKITNLHQSKKIKYVGNILHWAVISAKEAEVRDILQGAKISVNRLLKQNDNWGLLPVDHSFTTHTSLVDEQFPEKNKSVSIFNLFLENPNFSLFKRNKNDQNVFHRAVISKNLEAVNLLFAQLMANDSVKLKEMVCQKDIFGYPPLHYLFLDDLDKWTPNHSRLLEEFVKNKQIDAINAKDDQYLPLLYWLIFYNQSEPVAELLKLEKLETFEKFISNMLHTSDNIQDQYKNIPVYSKKLCTCINKILEAAVFFLRKCEEDTQFNNVSKNLLNKYFGINIKKTDNQLTINKGSDILESIVKTYNHNIISEFFDNYEKTNFYFIEFQEEKEFLLKEFDCFIEEKSFSGQDPAGDVDQVSSLVIDQKDVDRHKVQGFIKHLIDCE